MRIYLASGNSNKKRELSEILPGHEIVTPKDIGIAFAPEETGSTFYENSLIKAQALYAAVHAPVIADDSGICVDALGGLPGIYSSRYAGPDFPTGISGKKLPQEEQNRLLIGQLNDALKNGATVDRQAGLFPNGPRSCRYVCAMVLYLGPGRLYVAQETMEGTLVDRIDDARGNGGFGYDPLFIPAGCTQTAAELTAEQKNAISHRGKAVRAIQLIAASLPDFTGL